MTGITESSIMLVEDNMNLQESIIELLSYRGFHNITAFNDGFKAVTYCKTYSPDLAILDVEVHGLNGLDTLIELHSMKPTLPVIMMSSQLDKHVIIQACESGASTFFPKPFDSEMFCCKIDALLQKVVF